MLSSSREDRGPGFAQRMEAGLPGMGAVPDPTERKVLLARAEARAGRAAEAAAFYREAARDFASDGRPVQAVAAAFEAACLDPSGETPNEEAAQLGLSINSLVQSVSGQRLIGELGVDDRRALVARLHPLSLTTDQLLAREDDPGEALWFVVRGRVRVTRRGRRGGAVHVGVVGPGEVVGESSALGGAPRRATLTCEEPTELLELKAADLRALRGTRPGLASLLEKVRTGAASGNGGGHIAV